MAQYRLLLLFENSANISLSSWSFNWSQGRIVFLSLALDEGLSYDYAASFALQRGLSQRLSKYVYISRTRTRIHSDDTLVCLTRSGTSRGEPTDRFPCLQKKGEFNFVVCSLVCARSSQKTVFLCRKYSRGMRKQDKPFVFRVAKR